MKKEKNKGQSLPLHILKEEQEICQTVFLTEVVCTVLKVLRVNVLSYERTLCKDLTSILINMIHTAKFAAANHASMDLTWNMSC